MNLESAVELALQRTGPFIAMFGKSALRDWTLTGTRHWLRAALKPAAARDAFIAAAVAEIERDAAEFATLIGPCRRLVSIGVGSGIAEAHLCRVLGVESVLLVDTEEGGKGHGYAASGAGYASLEAARRRVEAVGVTVQTWNPDREPAPAFEFDALVSILAMGFHFPDSAYNGFVKRNAAPGAVLAYDYRESAGTPARRVVRRIG